MLHGLLLASGCIAMIVIARLKPTQWGAMPKLISMIGALGMLTAIFTTGTLETCGLTIAMVALWGLAGVLIAQHLRTKRVSS